MNIEEFQEKTYNARETKYFAEHINEMMELFCDLANQKYISFYKYEYEYNDYFHKVTLNKEGEEDNEINLEEKHYKILLRDNKYTYGYFLIPQRLKFSNILKKLLKKIVKYLAKEKDLIKKLSENEIPFNIYLIHENLQDFASNLKNGLESLFNAQIILDNTFTQYIDNIETNKSKNIIIFLIDDLELIQKYEKKLNKLNELIIVIGPNDHHISMYCGKLGIVDYISINEFKAENLKSLIVNKRNTLINKNKFGNKIIALGGISGGVGTTTIAMNISNLLAKNTPDKNLLYIDLSTTKAISNLFLERNPLPQKTIIDLINTSEFNLNNNLDNGLVKVRENFFAVTGIQKHLDKEYLEKDIFIKKFLDYISSCSEYFNFIIIDIGLADASNLKSTIYDIVNEIWLVTEMNIPHTSKLKTFYALMKRAGLKDKITFLPNRHDSDNSISPNDVLSILHLSNEEKKDFEKFKIPNDYKNIGQYWNFCELITQKNLDAPFSRKLNEILQAKGFYNEDLNKKSSNGIFSKLFKKG